ncbi:hypothetical protein SteCoe_25391 [Stentor coeruleus]|uniref:EF-hand domain-containing protein n=1 Tax=Stentor coeruleus TaxID=5963 RepID=A0A1R2BFF3_9CILI|nr:hypothetical protein SteCoe_25391 [Stentor coeruleus]
MNFSYHAKLNISAQIICSLFLLYSLCYTFFTGYTTKDLSLDIGLFSISFQSPSSEFQNLELQTKISSLLTVCDINQDFPLKDLCLVLPKLQAGGYFYIISLLVLQFCILNSAFSLWWVYTGRGPGKYESTNVLSPAILMVSLVSYSILGTFGSSARLISEGSGMVYCFFIDIVLVLLCLHYFLILKRNFITEFQLFEEPLPVENIPKHSRSGTQSKGPYDTGQSEDDVGFGARLRKKAMNQSQGVQVNEKSFCKEVIDDLSGEIEKLLDQKNRLEDSTNNLKKLMESSIPDIALYQSNIEIKNSEIKTLKDIIKNFKEKLIEKDIKLEEIERDLSVNKALAQALSSNNALLAKNLDERDRVLENIRNSGTFKSFDDASEKDSKRDNQSAHDRYTESTHATVSIAQSDRESMLDKLNYLNKALEVQKDINEQLHYKNKSLEEIKFKLEDNLNKLQKKQQGKSMICAEDSEGSRFQIPSEDLYGNKKLSDSEKLLNDQREIIKKLQDKKSQYKLQIQALQKALKDITDDRDRLADDLGSTKENLRSIEDLYIEACDKHIKYQEDWNIEKGDILYSKNILARELETLKSRLKIQEDAMNSEILEATNQIELLKDKLKYYEAEFETAQNEIHRLKDLQDFLKNDLVDKSSDPSEDIRLSPQKFTQLLSLTDPRFDKTLKDLDKSFHSIIDEKEDLRKSCVEKEMAILELSEINQKLSEQIYELKLQPVSSEKAFVYERPSMHSESSASSSYMSLQEMLIVESLADIDVRNNPLLDKVLKMKKEPPMIYSNLWKLMESLMEEKNKVDKLDLALKRRPRHAAEFTMDFMLSHFGLQSLANKQLKAMSQSLEELNKLNHPYGVFFCRLLALYHSRPISVDFSVFLLTVQHLFNGISLSNKLSKFADHYEIIQYGGHASIVDVMELVMKVCKNHRDVGERLILSIHKDSEQKLEIALLKVLGTMAKTNKKPKHFFELLDNNSTNSLDYHEFVDGIRYTLGIWITQEEAEAICAYIDTNSNGVITMEEWVGKVDFSIYKEKIYTKIAMVTKVQVLNAFIEEYELEMIEDYNKLRQTIKFRSLDQIEFERAMMNIEPNLKDHEIVKLFEEVRKNERTNNVSPEGFCIAVLKNKLGGYGIGSFELKDLAGV